MTSPSILSVILNYRTAPLTIRAATATLEAMKGLNGQVVIVDNDSQDGSFRALSDHAASQGWKADGRVRVVQSGVNGGYGAGNNIGITAGLSDGSKPDFVYVLNPDAFPASDAIRCLLAHLQDNPGVGIVGSYIHGEDGDAHLTTFRFPSIFSEFEGAINFGPVSRLLKHYTTRIPTPDHTRPVDWLAGASLMIRQSVLDQIGLFDEAFFLYFEETDLCRRAALAGHQTVFVRESEVAHIGSVSTGMKGWTRVPDYWFDSRLYYFIKNHGRIYAATATLVHLVGGGLHRLRCFVTRKTSRKAPRMFRTMAWHDTSVLVRSVFSPVHKLVRPNQPVVPK